MPVADSPNPLRVAFDVGPLHGPLTGIGRAVMGMRVGLSERPDDIVLTPYVLSYRAELQKGVTRLPYPAALAIRSWGTCARPRADRHLGDVNVVHGTNYVVPPSRRPRMVSVYDCWALDHPDQASPMVNRAMKALRRAVADGAVVHASSHATAASCRHHFGDCHVEVIHLGGPVRHVHPPSHISSLSLAAHTALVKGSPFVLSVGTLERRKNLPLVITAFAAAASGALRDHVLVIAGGDGDDAARVRAAIDALPRDVASRIVLTGRVDDESLHWLYSNASVVAYPSLDEGFGFPVLEAMSYGVPVVASNVGSIPEVAGDAALLVDLNDVDRFAGALSRSVSDSALRTALVESGHRRTGLFTWSATTERLVHLYRSLAV